MAFGIIFFFNLTTHWVASWVPDKVDMISPWRKTPSPVIMEHLTGLATVTKVFKVEKLTSTLCTLQAVNGVSNKSPYPAQQVSINITTNQAGE